MRVSLGLWKAMPKPWRGLLAALPALAMLALGSCDSPEELVVLITVQGSLAEVKTLEVSLQLNGVPAKDTQDITGGRMDRFAIYLPKDSEGNLLVHINGLSDDLCQRATGMAGVQVKPAPPYLIEVSVPVLPVPAKLCTLTVTPNGDGTLVSNPPGLICDGTSKCRYDFPFGTPVTLMPSPGSKSYGVAWGGACSGTDACKVTMNKRTQVNANFPGRLCSDGNWCWDHPLPSGWSMRAVWGSGASDYWSVGERGTIMHYEVAG